MEGMKKINKKIVIPIVGVIVVIIAVAVMLLAFGKNTEGTDYIEAIIEKPIEQSGTQTLENPIDFEMLKSANKDIYAWLEIPGTSVSYPVLQHPKDDSYYLTRSYDKSQSYYGAVFSQAKYNTTDFSDNCTVLYGHRMRNGSMFAGLSEYVNSEFMNSHSKFYIYMPDKVLEYEVCAAVPFDNRNILYTWDCTQKSQYWSLIQTIMGTRSMDSNVKADYDLNIYDKIVILSTCYPGDSSRRYLIVGKLI